MIGIIKTKLKFNDIFMHQNLRTTTWIYMSPSIITQKNQVKNLNLSLKRVTSVDFLQREHEVWKHER